MSDQAERDLFYVGYLPLPQSIKRFIVPWLIGNLVLAVGIAAVIAQQHRDPGDGVWQTGEAVTLEGWLEIEPYPILFVEDQAYILVEQGKLGVQDRLSGRTADVYMATGYLIEREGRRVLELDGADANALIEIDKVYAIAEVPGDAPNIDPKQTEPEDLGTHTLRGEIVDPKCYLGVMQPGDGKTHKACATLCIKGGIPPMLVVRDDKGNTAAYLLTDADGKAFPESHHEYIADPIEITGQILQDGDLLILRADLDSIRRLGSGD